MDIIIRINKSESIDKLNDKLVMKFMEVGTYHSKYYVSKNSTVCLFITEDSKNDWNWLMEIVKKIESLDTLNLDKEFNKELDKVLSKVIYSDIKLIYKVVVNFIKWYNERKDI